ncbi:kinase-like domain-containing protein [Yarrowia lipolytica]|uniref:Kinase-like domain-containing protein n=1 Tax=Yarrowia lipolytica TaxID=4952 RepID=A0A371CCC6_YARLL|nr:Putative serine/threonine-protein kinase [Yarrowia lipolytica]RDW27964.1 kinase-like domain-containing protein [Yarrowia lipolytica]RDW34115.1 kinase-like domain-containing protein [Yarrowia lipolytica]RDW37176.1 kinase-like domain-containing protein [Yarrowia lipolytica]SEI36709.1 YALIA101S13e01640g1_1 [Yarrowia lipolytica]
MTVQTSTEAVDELQPVPEACGSCESFDGCVNGHSHYPQATQAQPTQATQAQAPVASPTQPMSSPPPTQPQPVPGSRPPGRTPSGVSSYDAPMRSSTSMGSQNGGGMILDTDLPSHQDTKLKVGSYVPSSGEETTDDEGINFMATRRFPPRTSPPREKENVHHDADTGSPHGSLEKKKSSRGLSRLFSKTKLFDHKDHSKDHAKDDHSKRERGFSLTRRFTNKEKKDKEKDHSHPGGMDVPKARPRTNTLDTHANLPHSTRSPSGYTRGSSVPTKSITRANTDTELSRKEQSLSSLRNGGHATSAGGMPLSPGTSRRYSGHQPLRPRVMTQTRQPSLPHNSDICDIPFVPSTPKYLLSPAKIMKPSEFLPPEYNTDPPDMDICTKYAAEKKLSKTKQLGRGATAVVEKVNEIESKMVRAVKIYNKRSADTDAKDFYDSVAEEYVISRKLQGHRNIVRVMELCLGYHDSWCCVMEFCPQGDMFSLLESYKAQKKKMPKDERNCLFRQLLMGVAFMHRNGVAHRDIKPENLLLTDGTLKITDFGVSVQMFDPEVPDGPIKYCAGISGSEPYISPEVFESKVSYKEDTPEQLIGRYDGRLLDVWSCAIVFVNLVLNGGLFAKASMDDLNYKKFQDELDRYWRREENFQKFHRNELTGKGSQLDLSDSCGNGATQMGALEAALQEEANLVSSVVPSPRQSSSNLTGMGSISRSDLRLGGGEMAPLPYFNEMGSGLKRLIARMLMHDPRDRPYMPEIISSTSVRNIGMCFPVDNMEDYAPDQYVKGSLAELYGYDLAIKRVTSADQTLKKEEKFVRNHNHEPLSAPPSTFGIGTFRDPY